MSRAVKILVRFFTGMAEKQAGGISFAPERPEKGILQSLCRRGPLHHFDLVILLAGGLGRVGQDGSRNIQNPQAFPDEGHVTV